MRPANCLSPADLDRADLRRALQQRPLRRIAAWRPSHAFGEPPVDVRIAKRDDVARFRVRPQPRAIE
jgi:hypothetical protein